MAFGDYLNLYLARRTLRARRAEFYFDLSMALDDKVPLYTILRKHEVRARKRREPGMALLYQHMLKNATRGALAEALVGVAPPNELMMLDATQTAGDESVAEGLRFLAETVEKTERMKETMRKATVYPTLLMTLFFIMMLGFSFYVVPVLEGIIPASKWPPVGKALHAVSQGVRSYGPVLVASFAMAVAAMLYSLPRWTGRTRGLVDRGVLPYLLFRDYTGALFVVALATLMRAGISLRSALEQAMRYSNPWVRWHIKAILRRLSSAHSANFGAAFATGILNQELEDRISDASERKDPVAAFIKIGTTSVDKIQQDIEKSSARLNTILILFCGMTLGFMVIGFMTTAQQLGNSIRNGAMEVNSVK